MHELSIAISIIEMATEQAEQRGGVKICAVHLRLGQLAGVVKEALLFCYDLACQQTALEGSKLVIEELPVAIYCANCQTNRITEPMQIFICPVCLKPASELVQGRELEICALELYE